MVQNFPFPSWKCVQTVASSSLASFVENIAASSLHFLDWLKEGDISAVLGWGCGSPDWDLYAFWIDFLCFWPIKCPAFTDLLFAQQVLRGPIFICPKSICPLFQCLMGTWALRDEHKVERKRNLYVIEIVVGWVCLKEEHSLDVLKGVVAAWAIAILGCALLHFWGVDTNRAS